jgi:hypothetical protein
MAVNLRSPNLARPVVEVPAAVVPLVGLWRMRLIYASRMPRMQTRSIEMIWGKRDGKGEIETGVSRLKRRFRFQGWGRHFADRRGRVSIAVDTLAGLDKTEYVPISVPMGKKLVKGSMQPVFGGEPVAGQAADDDAGQVDIARSAAARQAHIVGCELREKDPPDPDKPTVELEIIDDLLLKTR